MTSITIYACAFPEPETYLVEVRRPAPHCRECEAATMEKLGVLLCRRRGGQIYEMELWRCTRCRLEESFMPGFYGEDDVEMTPAEHADYEAGERQKWRLEERYGTPKPGSIRDYWLRKS